MKTLDPLSGVALFIAVSETLNFAEAAERLGMSRATVSAQIGDLERRLGVRLFQRSTRAVRLTEAGEAALAAMFEIADEMRGRLLEGLAPEKVEELNALLSGLSARLDAGLPPPPGND